MPSPALISLVFASGLLASSATIVAAENGPGPSGLVSGETLEDFFSAAIDFSPRLRIAEEGLNIGRARERQEIGRAHV